MVAPKQIKQGGATTGQVLLWNGTEWAPSEGASVVGPYGHAPTAIADSNDLILRQVRLPFRARFTGSKLDLFTYTVVNDPALVVLDFVMMFVRVSGSTAHSRVHQVDMSEHVSGVLTSLQESNTIVNIWPTPGPNSNVTIGASKSGSVITMKMTAATGNPVEIFTELLAREYDFAAV